MAALYRRWRPNLANRLSPPVYVALVPVIGQGAGGSMQCVHALLVSATMNRHAHANYR